MKLAILTKERQESGSVELPQQFSEPVRPDLISRAVLAAEANARQPYGASPEAGKRASAKISRRRRNYRGSYGYGISRVPRKVLSRRGRRMFWVGAFAPGTVGGRQAHPPKPSKSWKKKINTKERRKAIRSAIAATVDSSLVKQRGHVAPTSYPFIIEDAFEEIAKTKDAQKAFAGLGLAEEFSRAMTKKIRAGKGKARGRKYIKKKRPPCCCLKAVQPAESCKEHTWLGYY